ncbi:MAG: FMN-binding glutamate synthase family protein [Bacillota bacterium]|nr:FMN-binding glutamate synthase family protein [Bacillota bacterium]MDW7683826.1 FMN-binding glutamate synthase family protein [Bacillota bacterium]
MKKVTDVMGINNRLLDEIAHRAFSGKPLVEHLGATKQFAHFDSLMFLPNQLHEFMLMDEQEVSTKTVIGPNAVRPLRIETPMMITGITYGVVNKAAKLALAKASKLAGTSANSGEGGMHQEEREFAAKYVIQYNRGRFSNSDAHLKLADMIEIKWGQGANPGTHSILKANKMDDELRRIRGLKPGEDSYMPPYHRNITNKTDLRNVVDWLRDLSGGVPISLKFCASRLREDIDVALDAGVDVIALDCAQGGTGGSLLLTENDFGIPTLYATAQAGKYLEQKGVKDKVSLIIAGGIRTPGDVMKALALGADAVYACTIFLLAMTLPQNQDTAHIKEPLNLVHYNVPESNLFDIERGAQSLANYILACTEEMIMACRLLGLQDIHQLNRQQLVALDEYTAKVTGIQNVYEL